MFRFLLTTISVLAILWTGGLSVFIHSMPVRSAATTAHSDVIVVLTGGDLRVAKGFALWQAGVAPKLFISGVGKNVSRHDFIHTYATGAMTDSLLSDPGQLVLDYAANNTQSNALETSKFMKKNHYRSMHLVTASYHMPRALLECKLYMPEVKIIADPVSPPAFRRDMWWRHPNTRRLVLSEYHKYWLVRARALIGQLP